MALRAVDDSGGGSPIADRIRAIAEQAIAEGAVVFTATWEGPAEFSHASAPDADAVTIGNVLRLARKVNNEILPPDYHTDG